MARHSIMPERPSLSAPSVTRLRRFSFKSQARMRPTPPMRMAAAKLFPPGAEQASSTLMPFSGAAASTARRAAASCT